MRNSYKIGLKVTESDYWRISYKKRKNGSIRYCASGLDSQAVLFYFENSYS
ncbi:hypothetical protein MMG00_04390 [Ignatzschineria rhizosphaerae]|uniref:Integrase n=1 Tax=Ignatzschineria rhizosphaerae TaxID=2923279 RepID=A0ABY3X2I5_9GAMM|nr:hypothetical protein [Ignatzschineria rhizosphaerae]UNM97093.1 hypothetical protein MMG00_04390 [Ignatzschineria rhizosphaerae]